MNFMALSRYSTRTQFSSTLNNKLLQSLQEISKETDVPVSKLLDRAVKLLLEQYDDNDKK